MINQASQKTHEQIRAAVYALPQSDACCRALSELEYTALTPGNTLSYEQTTELDIIRLAAGASHAKGFRLDGEDLPASLEIRTVLGAGIVGRMSFMVPSIMIIDANFNVIADLKTIYLSERTHHRFAKAELQGYVHFDRARHAGARYILIYFDPSKVGHNYTVCTVPGGSFFGPISMPISPDGGCLDIPVSHTGELLLTLNRRRY